MGQLLIITSCSKDDFSYPEKVFNGDTILITQAQLDAFGENNFTIINGVLEIGLNGENNTISNLNKLSSLREVEFLDIHYQNNLKSLEGLSNLKKAGFIRISHCSSLTSLKGLENLERIELNGNLNTEFGVMYNKSLESLEGLDKLEYIEGSFIIGYNDNLRNLNGIMSLKTIMAELMVISSENGTLQNINGLSSIKSVGYNIWIKNNNFIKNIDGLSNLEITSGIAISDNDQLLDYCGIRDFLINSKNIFFNISNNLYNATYEDIINGSCKP